MTEEEKTAQITEYVTRVVSFNLAAGWLLDAAMALNNGEIKVDAFSRVVDICVQWGNEAATSDIETLKKIAKRNSDRIKELVPAFEKKGNIDKDEFNDAMSKLVGKELNLIPPEQRKKMN